MGNDDETAKCIAREAFESGWERSRIATSNGYPHDRDESFEDFWRHITALAVGRNTTASHELIELGRR